MNMFPFNFEFSEKECPSLYEEGEHPSELLQSINNKLDKEDTIIENQKVQKELDKNFNNITMKILSQTSKLSKELNLTDFANFALKMYAQSNQEK